MILSISFTPNTFKPCHPTNIITYIPTTLWHNYTI